VPRLGPGSLITCHSKGAQLVGVARQYCGQFGTTDKRQIPASLSVANHSKSGNRLEALSPQEWASDNARRKQARVPEEVSFMTKVGDCVGTDSLRRCAAQNFEFTAFP